MVLKLMVISFALVVLCTAQQFYANTRYGKRESSHTRDNAGYGNARTGRSDSKVDVAVRNDRFFLGSRYGKRSNDMQSTEQNMGAGRKWGEFNSRNDGFFFGSRYGKRNEIENAIDSDDEHKEINQLNCVYTGFGVLYNCFPKSSKMTELLF